MKNHERWCSLLGEPIMPRVLARVPFCPLWYHTVGVPAIYRLGYSARWLFSAALKRIASCLGSCRASDETVARRLTICYDCTSLSDNRCAECGCPVRPKAALALESCPLKKWDRVAPTTSCAALLWLGRRGIVFSDVPPAWFARIFRPRPNPLAAKTGCSSC